VIRNSLGVYAMPDDQIDLLRSVLARAYEKPQPSPLRLQAVRNYVDTRTPRKPIIESLNITEGNDSDLIHGHSASDSNRP
jgi:hypothetical protein